MNKAWIGKLIAGLIVLGVGAILVLNLAPGRPPTTSAPTPGPRTDSPTPEPVSVVGEHSIGDEVTANHMRIGAVWLSAVAMDGMSSTAGPGQTPIHIEADVKALEGNPQGFGKDQDVPYLKVSYSVEPAKGGPAIDRGDLGPMVAKDGFHYGATIAMPKPGDYRLIYAFQPGSVNGLGLHRDRATGVAPWWEPFQVSFEWTVEPENTVAGK